MKYLYYRLWQLLRLIKTNDMPATNAVILLSMCQIGNLGLLYILAKRFFFAEFEQITRQMIYLYSVTVGLIVFVINYFYLYRNKKKLFERYQRENQNKIVLGNALLIFYVLISFFTVFYFGSKYFPI